MALEFWLKAYPQSCLQFFGGGSAMAEERDDKPGNLVALWTDRVDPSFPAVVVDGGGQKSKVLGVDNAAEGHDAVLLREAKGV